MQNIKVTRYADPKATGWAGYIEPADKSWIGFVGIDGRPILFLSRDPGTGAVLPDDPAERAAAVASIRDEQARRAAFEAHVPGVVYPSFAGETFGGGLPVPPDRSPVDGVLAGRGGSR
jgi:hypothetical protein